MKIRLNIRKTMDGNLLVNDHPLFDIAIVPKDRKLILFPKGHVEDEAYHSQMRCMDFLAHKGAISLGTTQGGSLYNSLEAILPEREGYDEYQVLVLSLHKFIIDDMESLKHSGEYDEDVSKTIFGPSDEDSTELGEVPHAVRKGTVPDRPYGKYGGYYGYFY